MYVPAPRVRLGFSAQFLRVSPGSGSSSSAPHFAPASTVEKRSRVESRGTTGVAAPPWMRQYAAPSSVTPHSTMSPGRSGRPRTAPPRCTRCCPRPRAGRPPARRPEGPGPRPRRRRRGSGPSPRRREQPHPEPVAATQRLVRLDDAAGLAALLAPGQRDAAAHLQLLIRVVRAVPECPRVGDHPGGLRDGGHDVELYIYIYIYTHIYTDLSIYLCLSLSLSLSL